MTRSPLFAALALTLACAAPARAEDCSFRHSVPWTAAGAGYTINAISDGPACDKVVLAIAVHGPDGKTLMTYSTFREPGGSDNLQFDDAKTGAQVKKALLEWVTRDQKRLPTTGSLPDWKEKAASPGGAEDSFSVDPSVKRADYLAIRKAKRPLFCWVAGRESEACVYLGTDGKTKDIGGFALAG